MHDLLTAVKDDPDEIALALWAALPFEDYVDQSAWERVVKIFRGVRHLGRSRDELGIEARTRSHSVGVPSDVEDHRLVEEAVEHGAARGSSLTS